MDVISLRDLRVLAFCGVLAEEKARRQPFLVNVDIGMDLTSAGASDDLEKTLNYGDAAASIERIAEHQRFDLLERFATVIATEMLDDERVQRVTVTVDKLRPPVQQDLRSSAVTVTRTR